MSLNFPRRFTWARGSEMGRSPVDDLMNRIDESATLLTAPYDHALWEKAEQIVGPYDIAGAQREYERLILEKYRRPRGFWARLFGR
jgi:hypothetical protein